MRRVIPILLLLSCAGPTGPAQDYSAFYGKWLSPDGQMCLTLHEDGRYTRSESYRQEDFVLLESGYVDYGPTLLFTRVYLYGGAWWEESTEVGYKLREDTLWLGSEVWYR